MSAFWVVVFFGAVVAPWVVNGGRIRLGFQEVGLLGGFGVWFGSAIITTTIALAGYWIAGFLF